MSLLPKAIRGGLAGRWYAPLLAASILLQSLLLAILLPAVRSILSPLP